MLNAKPYCKPQQWHDSKQIIDEFIRFFTCKAHVSMNPLFQFGTPTSFLLWSHPWPWTLCRTLIPITQVSTFEYSLREIRPSLIYQWWHWGPLLSSHTTWLPPPLVVNFHEEVYKVKKWLAFQKPYLDLYMENNNKTLVKNQT